jgi:hypothetical protein
MFNQTGDKVWGLVQDWNPKREYNHERKFQSDLKKYLDEALNNSSSLMGSNTDYRVSTERGTSKGDVVVNDVVGIELKRDFTNSQKRKLRGQLEDYADNYNFVVACACGIQDTDGWYEVKQKILDSRQFGDRTEFRFEIKESCNFGKQGSSGSSGFW